MAAHQLAFPSTHIDVYCMFPLLVHSVKNGFPFFFICILSDELSY